MKKIIILNLFLILLSLSILAYDPGDSNLFVDGVSSCNVYASNGALANSTSDCRSLNCSCITLYDGIKQDFNNAIRIRNTVNNPWSIVVNYTTPRYFGFNAFNFSSYQDYSVTHWHNISIEYCLNNVCTIIWTNTTPVGFRTIVGNYYFYRFYGNYNFYADQIKIKVMSGHSDVGGDESLAETIIGEFEFLNLSITDNTNQLPNFIVNTTNYCINKNETGIKINLQNSCNDPEGDTCYFSVNEQTALNTIYKQSFGSFDSIYFNVDILDFHISWPVWNTPVNHFFDNQTFVTNCKTNGNLFDSPNMYISQFSDYNVSELLGYSLYNADCFQDSYFVFPDNFLYDRGTKIIYFKYGVPKNLNTEWVGTSFFIRDNTNNKLLNLTLATNTTAGNNYIYLNNVLVYNLTDSGISSKFFIYNPRIVWNTSNNKYYVAIYNYNTSLFAYNLMYRSSEYDFNSSNIKYFYIYPYTQSKFYLDDIIFLSYSLNYSWSTTLQPLETNYTGTITYKLLYTDSAHKDFNVYNETTITFKVLPCGEVVSPIDSNSQLGSALNLGNVIISATCNDFNVFVRLFSSLGFQFMDMCNFIRWMLYILAFFIALTICGILLGFGVFSTDIIFSMFSIIQVIFVVIFSYLIEFTNDQKIISALICALGVVMLIRLLFISNGGNSSVQQNS